MKTGGQKMELETELKAELSSGNSSAHSSSANGNWPHRWPPSIGNVGIPEHWLFGKAVAKPLHHELVKSAVNSFPCRNHA